MFLTNMHCRRRFHNSGGPKAWGNDNNGKFSPRLVRSGRLQARTIQIEKNWQLCWFPTQKRSIYFNTTNQTNPLSRQIKCVCSKFKYKFSSSFWRYAIKTRKVQIKSAKPPIQMMAINTNCFLSRTYRKNYPPGNSHQ